MRKLSACIQENVCNVVNVQYENTDGSIDFKTITIDSFISILTQSYEVGESRVTLGRLPHGFINASFSRLRDNTFDCTVCVKSASRLLYYEKSQYDVWFPDLIFSFSVDSGRVISGRCFAVDSTIPLSGASVLYHYPFGNVYNNGDICWGHNKLPVIKQLSDIDLLVTLFFNASTNNDLYVPGQNIKKVNCTQTQRAFLEKLKTMDSFPCDYLVAAGNVAYLNILI